MKSVCVLVCVSVFVRVWVCDRAPVVYEKKEIESICAYTKYMNVYLAYIMQAQHRQRDYGDVHAHSTNKKGVCVYVKESACVCVCECVYMCENVRVCV